MYSVTLLHAFFADLSKITGLLVFDQSQQGIHLFKMSKEEMEQLRSTDVKNTYFSKSTK